jgi:hypothetical protein
MPDGKEHRHLRRHVQREAGMKATEQQVRRKTA